MTILRSLDGKFYELDDTALEGKEVNRDDIKDLPPSLPPPPEPDEKGGDVEGHWPCWHWHDCHWYNWHNHCHWH